MATFGSATYEEGHLDALSRLLSRLPVRLGWRDVSAALQPAAWTTPPDGWLLMSNGRPIGWVRDWALAELIEEVLDSRGPMAEMVEICRQFDGTPTVAVVHFGVAEIAEEVAEHIAWLDDMLARVSEGRWTRWLGVRGVHYARRLQQWLDDKLGGDPAIVGQLTVIKRQLEAIHEAVKSQLE